MPSEASPRYPATRWLASLNGGCRGERKKTRSRLDLSVTVTFFKESRESRGMVKLSSEFEVVCPCCGATQTVDANLRRVVAHQTPVNENKPELDQAQRILAEEAARREALFQQSVSNEQTRGDALSKRFDEALKQAQQEPITRPDRDFDLD